ncbi:hypothetical protein KY363_00785 [Candidatus Woesearchaeota archaeon]|nr:hypothetical protein [Candidatus Woesearchaeota archaeon]
MASVASGHEERIAQYQQLIQTKKHDLVELDERIKLDKQAGFDTAELETQKAGIEQEIDELNKMIEFQKEQEEQDAENAKKEAVIGAVGMAGPWGKVASVVAGKKQEADEASQAKRAEASENKMEKALEGAEGKADAAAAKAASASAARPPQPSTPSQTPQPKMSGNAGLAQNIASGKTGSGGGSSSVSPISVIIVIFSVVAGTWLLRASATPSITSVLPFVFIIASVVIWEKTPKPHAWYITLIVIALFVGAAYFGSSTYAYAMTAITSGSAEKQAADTAVTAKQTTSSVIQNLITNYQNQVAYATGQRVEGDVKEDQPDTGIEILPPLVAKGNGNTITVTEKESKYLDAGIRVKGVDPKASIKVGVTCHLKNKSSVSVTTSTGPDLSPGTAVGKDKVRPSTIEGYSFTRDVTCYPTIDKCGDYILTFSAQADNLRTDSEKIDNIIDKEVLTTALNNYAAANKELTST